MSFKVGKTKILCISCHLASGHNKIERRNQDWRNIFSRLVLKQKIEDSPSKNSVGIESDLAKTETPYDAIIWLGDYNYRINGVAGAIIHAMKRNMYEVLLNND